MIALCAAISAGEMWVACCLNQSSKTRYVGNSAWMYAIIAGRSTPVTPANQVSKPLAGPDGRTEMLLQNPKADRGVSLIFPVQQLPCVTLWKNLAAIEEGYVTGIEPGTGFPYTRRLERAAGRVPKLAPNETRSFNIEVSIHLDPAGVESAARRVNELQGGIKPVVDYVSPH